MRGFEEGRGLLSKLVLTFDLDWAHDTVIADTVSIVEKWGISATWFVTHSSPLLNDISAIGGQELGVHPNFNPLLEGTGGGSAWDILARLLEIVPIAKSVRSHSLVQSSRLRTLFREHDLTHESNCVIPPLFTGVLAPWKDFSGLVQVPIRWEDDLRLIDPSFGEPVDLLSAIKPLTVDFHPIHIFLNTVTIDDYESARTDFLNPAALLKRRRPLGAGGSRDRLLALLEAAASGGDSGTCLSSLQFATEDCP
jgi:hypothetical protein